MTKRGKEEMLKRAARRGRSATKTVVGLEVAHNPARMIEAEIQRFSDWPSAIGELAANAFDAITRRQQQLADFRSGRLFQPAGFGFRMNLPPRVFVKVDPRAGTFSIADNGDGIPPSQLWRLTTFHGVNEAKLAGLLIKGEWGTGKSAIFIGEEVCITTVAYDPVQRAYFRSVIEGRYTPGRAEKGEIPVTFRLLSTKKVGAGEGPIRDFDTGTLIEIRKLRIPVDIDAIRTALEREIVGSDIEVRLNGARLSTEPPAKDGLLEARFDLPPEAARIAGNTHITLYHTLKPLPRDQRGVTIRACRNHLEQYTGGNVGWGEEADRIYAVIDCPRLIDPTARIRATNVSRIKKLNENNEIVAIIHAFAEECYEKFRASVIDLKRRNARERTIHGLERMKNDIATFFNEFLARLGRTGGNSRLFELLKEMLPVGEIRELKLRTVGRMILTDEELELPFVQLPRNTNTRKRDKKKPESNNASGRNENEKKQTQDEARRGKVVSRFVRDRTGLSLEIEHLGENVPAATCAFDSGVIRINADWPKFRAFEKAGSFGDTPAFRLAVFEAAIDAFASAYVEQLVDRSILLAAEALRKADELRDELRRELGPLYGAVARAAAREETVTA